tara:strand:- start:2952 stop:3719 length:768 start_codon:yes stop_codon:yes gene_type:complete
MFNSLELPIFLKTVPIKHLHNRCHYLKGTLFKADFFNENYGVISAFILDVPSTYRTKYHCKIKFMEVELFQKKHFDQINYSDSRMPGEAYEKCKFTSCNFTNSDLSRIEFIDCQFFECNFSLTKIDDAAFKNTGFNQCKIMGIDFGKCDDFLFIASFLGCNLDYSIFHGKNLKKFKFDHCSLKDVDFSNADLTLAIFDSCDLLAASFFDTILEKADFRTSYNYSLDPENNKIKKAKFSVTGLPGLLSKYNLDVEY